jgi:hypothetical protein
MAPIELLAQVIGGDGLDGWSVNIHRVMRLLFASAIGGGCFGRRRRCWGLHGAGALATSRELEKRNAQNGYCNQQRETTLVTPQAG